MDQGCPLSGVEYQFYNADLLEITNRKEAEDCIRFVNDTIIIAEGANLQEAFKKLTTVTSNIAVLHYQSI